MPNLRHMSFEKIIKSKIDEIRGFINSESVFPEYLWRDDLKDEADIAENAIRNELKIALNENQRRNISALERALLRIKSGNFGVCSECEEPISKKRLMARPESTLCIDCQKKMEKISRFRQ